MSFWAKSFIFDGIPSEIYDMRVFSFEAGGLVNSPAGANIEIFDKQIYRKPKPYFYGVSQRPVLQFPLTFGSFNVVNGDSRSLIKKWLFGNLNYKILQLVQCDLDGIYFNCFLTDPSDLYVANVNYAFSCTVTCDAPWGWEYPKTITHTYSGSSIQNRSFTFNNLSDDLDYMYPTLSFTLNSLGGDFTLTNASDSSRIFKFTGLSAGETITVDNYRQIITSSTGLYRISNFNLNWFRLLSNLNNLSYVGAIDSFSMTYQEARKIGG
jgi:phage-related protein